MSAGYDVYCLRTRENHEVEAAVNINTASRSFLALPFLRLLHRKIDGVWTLKQSPMLGGYIFLYAPKGTATLREAIFQDIYPHVFFALEDSSGERVLSGSDLKYAQWVLSFGGIIGVSKAIKQDIGFEIVGGPLFELQESVLN